MDTRFSCPVTCPALPTPASGGKPQAHSEDHCMHKGAHFWSGMWQKVPGKCERHRTALSKPQVRVEPGSGLSLGQQAFISGVWTLRA